MMDANTFDTTLLQGKWQGYFFVAKKRPTIIYLHDALGADVSWKKFPQQLFEVFPHNGFVFSRFGHGGTRGEKNFNQKNYLSLETEQLHEFIHTNQIQNPILIGSSDGGSIALIYASRYATKAVISLAGHYKVEKITKDGVKATKKEATSNKILKGLQKIHHQTPEQAHYLLMDWQSTWTSSDYSDWNISQTLSKVTCPVLALQGKDDPYATDAHVKEIAYYIGENATSIIIDNAAHFPHLEQPQNTLNHIQHFLNHLPS